MQDNLTLAERILAFLFLPATLYGAGGAFLHSTRKGRSSLQVVLEAIGGAITTNMLSPLIVKFTPLEIHYTLFFFAGWGGLELVGRMYEAIASAAEKRIHNQINPGDRE